MSAIPSVSKIGQLFRRGWIEIPDVMVGLGLVVSGIGLGVYGIYQYNKREIKKPFKKHYIVMRDDDPRAEKYLKFHKNPVY